MKIDVSTFQNDMTVDETAQWFRKRLNGGNVHFVVYSVFSTMNLVSYSQIHYLTGLPQCIDDIFDFGGAVLNRQHVTFITVANTRKQ
jgi:hypothetical protein